MKVLIIEDEPATAQRLEKMLKTLIPDILLYETIDTVEDSVNYFNKGNTPDLVFMDIHLADGNSFEIFEQTVIKCPIIFTTAYDQYAIKAFKVNSIDYILKPINKVDLENSLKKYQESYSATTQNVFDINQMMELIQNKAQPELKRLIVKIGPKINAIKILDIAYFQVVNKAAYAVLFMGNRYPIDYTMEQLESELNKEQFFRVNRSFIICFDAIKSMTAYSKSRIRIELKPYCEQEVLSSTNRTGQFKSWLKGK